MTENNKPEWFEIIEADEKPKLRKVSKSLPVSAVIVAALILGAGAVVGQSQSKEPVSASNASSANTSADVAMPGTGIAATVAANKLANPSISQLPTGGDDEDDDEYEDEDDEYEDEDEDDDDDDYEDEDDDEGDDD